MLIWQDCSWIECFDFKIESFYTDIVTSVSQKRILHGYLIAVIKGNSDAQELSLEMKSRFILRLRCSSEQESSNYYGKYRVLIAEFGERHLQLQYAQMYAVNHPELVQKYSDDAIKIPEGWRKSELEVSPFIRNLIVPQDITDAFLSKSASFRDTNQVPRAVYQHSHTKAIVARSGQPLVGAQKPRRCIEDEMLVNVILKSSAKQNQSVIIEARSKQQALLQKQRGGGSELDGSFYPGCSTFFANIDTTTQICDQFTKLLDATLNVDCTTSLWTDALGSWMRNVQSCLSASYAIARLASIDGANSLIHCDNGIEVTSIIISLSKVIMDPHYRTIDGFFELIQSDWIDSGFSFGIVETSISHSPTSRFITGTDAARAAATQVFQDTASAFNQTINQMQNIANVVTLAEDGLQDRFGSSSSMEQPNALDLSFSKIGVFALFLDCVQQVWVQYPQEFEYNVDALLLMYESTIGNSPFGTFWALNPQEVIFKQLDSTTASLQKFVQHPQRIHLFKNAVYEPVIDINVRCPPLPVSFHSAKLEFWHSLYDCNSRDSKRLKDIIFDPNFYSTKGDIQPSLQSSHVNKIQSELQDLLQKIGATKAALLTSQAKCSHIQDLVDKKAPKQLDHPLQS